MITLTCMLAANLYLNQISSIAILAVLPFIADLIFSMIFINQNLSRTQSEEDLRERLINSEDTVVI